MSQYDVVIVGAGPTGLACAIAAQRHGLNAIVIDKGCIVNSIYNYPTQMVFFTTSELLEIGDIPMTAASAKPTRLEALAYYRRVAQHYRLDVRQYERVESVRKRGELFHVSVTDSSGEARVYESEFVVLAIGYYDLHNWLGVPGEDLPHVLYYYREAHPFAGQRVIVVGGKNSAADTALDLWRHGADVTLLYRRPQLSSSIKYWVRPDIENRLKAGEIRSRLNCTLLEIRRNTVLLRHNDTGTDEELPADFVFALIGYHPDFEFLQSAGVELDPESKRPLCNPETYESSVGGLYLAGVILAGRHTGEIFIENGRFHGGVVIGDIARKRAGIGERV
jgi:thioredoxin reductase (NADPH)